MHLLEINADRKALRTPVVKPTNQFNNQLHPQICLPPAKSSIFKFIGLWNLFPQGASFHLWIEFSTELSLPQVTGICEELNHGVASLHSVCPVQ